MWRSLRMVCCKSGRVSITFIIPSMRSRSASSSSWKTAMESSAAGFLRLTISMQRLRVSTLANGSMGILSWSRICQSRSNTSCTTSSASSESRSIPKANLTSVVRMRCASCLNVSVVIFLFSLLIIRR